MKRALITKVLYALKITDGDGGPLPFSVYSPLVAAMQFTKIKFTRGRESYDPISGQYQRTVAEQVAMHSFSDDRCLLCPAGYMLRVYTHLIKLGYNVDIVDASPPRKRPDALVPDMRVVNNPEQFGLSFRYRQRECAIAVIESIKAKRGGFIVGVPGFGKSFIAPVIARSFPHAKICVTTVGIDVCDKTATELLTLIPNVGKVDGSTKDHQRVTVCSAQSLHHIDDMDIFIVDEADMFLTPTLASRLGDAVGNAIPIGMSATTTSRVDGADKMLEPMFGPALFEIGWQEAVSNNLVVPIRVHWTRVTGPDPAAQYAPHTPLWQRHAVTRNEHRNNLIVQAAKEVPDDEQLLIFAAHTEHLAYLSKLLPDYELCYGAYDEAKFKKWVDLGLIDKHHTKISRKARKAMREAFTVGKLTKVICTDVWAVGVSFNSLSHLIRADARKSDRIAEQLPSRTSRIDGQKQFAVVRDFWDEQNESLNKSAVSRRRSYIRRGWEQLGDVRGGRLPR